MVHAYLILLTVIAVALMAFEKASMAVIGVGLLLAVSLPGLLPVNDAVASFAMPAIITVGALCVVGEGLARTGVATLLARRLLGRGSHAEVVIIIKLTVVAALASAVVNNTLVVVAFLPVVTTLCRQTGLYPSRLLIPLSYASILGGVCTLVGTSTNLLVSGLMEHAGLAPLTMFELTPIGATMTLVGLLFLTTFGHRLLPRIPSLSTMPGAQEVAEYVTEVRIGHDSPRIGRPAGELLGLESTTPVADDSRKGSAPASTEQAVPRAQIVMVIRDEEILHPPFARTQLEAGDVVVVRGPVSELAKRIGVDGLCPPGQSPQSGADSFDPRTMSFFELALTPASPQIGRSVKALRLEREHGAVAVAVQRHGQHLRQRVARLRLQAGDVVLAYGDARSKASLRRSRDYHLIEGVDDVVYRTEKAPHAIVITVLLMAALASGAVDPCLCALGAAMAFIAMGCMSTPQALTAVPLPILLFIGGTVALSKASIACGTTAFLGNSLVDLCGGFGPAVLLAGVFLGALVLTEFLSNNAMAVIMTPIAIEAARAAGADPRIFALAIAFGASASFANPLGYTTNLIVFGQGGYRVRDFLKVGLPMNVLIGATGIILLIVFHGP